MWLKYEDQACYKYDWNMELRMLQIYWNMEIDNGINVTEIWILRMLQMWLKYEYWEYYKCDWNMKIENDTNMTEMWILRMLQMWMKYECWEYYKYDWNMNLQYISITLARFSIIIFQ